MLQPYQAVQSPNPTIFPELYHKFGMHFKYISMIHFHLLTIAKLFLKTITKYLTFFLFSTLISSIIGRNALETLQKPHSSVYNYIHLNLILTGTKQLSAYFVVLRCVWSVIPPFTIREFAGGCRWLTTQKHAPYQSRASSYIRVNQKIKLKILLKDMAE